MDSAKSIEAAHKARLADKIAKQNIEAAATQTRLKDFARGTLKAVTTDIPGFIADIVDKIVGDTNYLGEKDRSSQMFEKITGSKSSGSSQEKLGGLFSPQGLGTGAKAIIIPALGIKSFKEIREASKALKSGADAQEVYSKTGIFSAPLVEDLRTVISDKDVKLNDISELFKGWPDIALDTWKDTPLSRLIDHPELFSKVPGSADIPVRGAFGFNDASFHPDSGHIMIGPTNSEKEFISNLLHEVQHSMQHTFDMPSGGNPKNFLNNPKKLDDALSMLVDARNTLKQQWKNTSGVEAKKAVDDRRQEIVNAYHKLSAVKDDSLKNYQRLAGEAEARAVEGMFNSKDYTTVPNSSKFYVEENISNLILDKHAVGKLDDDPVIKAIIDAAVRAKAVKDSIK